MNADRDTSTRSVMNRRFVVLSAILTMACQESPSSPATAMAPGFVSLRGQIALQASGMPVISEKAVVPATFAVAVLDSVSGPYILAFNERGAGTGDFFILALSETRTGAFGPCADGPSTVNPDGSVLTLAGPCQGRLLAGAAPSGLVLRSRSFLYSIGGTVTVTSAGDRLVGTVSNLKLAGVRADSGGVGWLCVHGATRFVLRAAPRNSLG
jgi:hypothetical protein